MSQSVRARTFFVCADPVPSRPAPSRPGFCVVFFRSYFPDRHAIVDGDPEEAFKGDGVVTVEGELTVRMPRVAGLAQKPFPLHPTHRIMPLKL